MRHVLRVQGFFFLTFIRRCQTVRDKHMMIFACFAWLFVWVSQGKVWLLPFEICGSLYVLLSFIYRCIFFPPLKTVLFPLFAVSVRCLAMSEPTLLTVALGNSILLNCTYNCSSGFIRASWNEEPDSSKPPFRNGSVCVVSLLLNNVSTEDLGRNYTCHTKNTDDFNPLAKIQLVVSLQLQGKRA